MTNTIEVTVLEKELRPYGGPITDAKGNDDSRVVDLIAWLYDQLAGLPTEHRTELKIEIRASEGYEGCTDMWMRLYYKRPETAEEIVARKAEAKAKLEAQRFAVEQQLEIIKRRLTKEDLGLV